MFFASIFSLWLSSSALYLSASCVTNEHKGDRRQYQQSRVLL